jgi:hypothetical protein
MTGMHRHHCVPLLLWLSGIGASSAIVAAAAATASAPDPALAATLARIRDAAMSSDWTYQHLEQLTDRVGPRLAGSAQQSAAIDLLATELRALGATVQLQPAKVPHWVRGEARAELIGYAGRPQGVTQALHLTALGMSAGTSPAGLIAPVIVVHSFDELQARAAEVRGHVVLFEWVFDERLADSGHPDFAYGEGHHYRVDGPSAAAALGASAALVRSIGGADYRLPHTGITNWKPGQSPIPAAALSAEDADLITRLAAQGPVVMKLQLGCQTLPDVDSANLIADWPGSEHPEQLVIVSGHLDSWDLGTGATDDGIGVMTAAGVIQLLQQLQLHGRRTIRFIGWADEEFSGQSSQRYFDSVQATLAQQTAAIESDEGAGRSLGVRAAVRLASLAALQPVQSALAVIGAPGLEYSAGRLGADISALQAAGVPGFSPLLDARRYFDYHHTAADTFDKVDPQNLRTQLATLAVLAYDLAQLPEPLPRTQPP